MIHMGSKLRAYLVVPFLRGLIHKWLVTQWIRLRRFDSEQIAADGLLNHLRHIFCTPQHFIIVHNDACSGDCVHTIGAYIFRDRKVCNQNVAAIRFLLIRNYTLRRLRGRYGWFRLAAG